MGISRSAFMATTAIVCVATATPALAQAKSFDVPAQSATTGIAELGRQADIQIVAARKDTEGKQVNAVRGDMTVEQALALLLKGTGLTARRTGTQTWSVVRAAEPPAAADEYRGNEIVVTAQKRVESVQDVPIAVTALSQKTLEEQKIEGGPDIMRAVPNLTFSKSNFTGYNLSIRGVGTKAVSATSDPGVAVSFNNSGLIHNRFFEQEFFDMERVEVLRGPQGTLYGRNATGGVVNLITTQPDFGGFEGSIKGEVGNYNSRRLLAMLNVPLVDDVLAVRVAGSMTQRSGYDYNATTKNRINGRDLWSLRTTVAFEPAPWFRANLIWERFNENDNRSRTGKQLCHRDDGPTHVGDVDLADGANIYGSVEIRRALFGQGCKPGSLYDDGAFDTPNGLSYSFILAPVAMKDGGQAIGVDPVTGQLQSVIQPVDPYGGLRQIPNLRTIESIRDPRYRAKADLLQFNLDVDITPALTFTSQTAYNEDQTYSFQDYNRFKSLPVFTDTTPLLQGGVLNPPPSPYHDLIPGGIFCDPQIGCSDTIAGFDISQAKSKQFNQEFRLQSSFDGPFNFSAGVNYTRFKTLTDYYVMFNVLTATAWGAGFYPPFGQDWDPNVCQGSNTLNGGSTGSALPVPASDPLAMCPYVDPNPVESIDGNGHNYFRSKNPYKLTSSALFGELYYNIRDDLKLTAGFRYTEDRKTFTPVPSQVLLARSLIGGGTVSAGYPEDPPIKQKWGEWTGRIGLDWKPDVGFTDDTMLYAFYSRGYKGGGANPPSPGFATKEEWLANAIADGVDQGNLTFIELFNQLPVLELTGVEYGQTFDPEFVDAFEIGAKNSLLNGALTLNLTGFYYDYKDYQVSQIRDRTAVNENFDAKVWGLEFETVFAPTRNLRLNANIGYLRTKIGKGETSIDIMNRTQGNPDYTLVKPWMQLPSNCVVPTHVAAEWARTNNGVAQYYGLCGGVRGLIGGFIGSTIRDPAFGGALYDVNNYPELNGGAGLKADLGGNELPNSPRWTANFGAQYTVDFDPDWSATIRGDAYWQAKSWARVYNLAPYDRLRDWTNFNISLRVDGPDDLTFEAYVKNVFNSTPLTDAFLNSDDTGLTTNVFTLDPRIIGFSIAKKF
ncbi:TonB-dependent receptor domain-containing protein [Sphingopyxis panaciterrulae]|uniref:Outer membrane receptor protein involved in Fe transport n=1 Tax=Sphingopyxis panaciterrulae TaxID=462372 RepID=A0A7W9B4R1_9SPHN|nr:TonB-dependent receptor [Sphingopyxis panaciterrulae]MBB5705936.1 outer membrane receptor protein involved in Fe transport [Sphingopyxis panaciterrulae]